MARQIKNHTEIYEYKDRYFRGTEDWNFSKYLPDKVLDMVLWPYILPVSIPIWAFLIWLGIFPLSIGGFGILPWAIPPVIMYKAYEKDRYADVPSTLRGRLFLRYFMRKSRLWVNGRPYHGTKRIVQVKIVHPRQPR